MVRPVNSSLAIIPQNFNCNDGLGWLIDLECLVLHTFPQFTREEVDKDIPMDQLWVYFNWAVLNDPMNKFSGVEIDGLGYIGMERKQILDGRRKS